MMTNGDLKGWIFLIYPHTNNGSLFFLTTAFLFKNKLPEVPDRLMMDCFSPTFRRFFCPNIKVQTNVTIFTFDSLDLHYF